MPASPEDNLDVEKHPVSTTHPDAAYTSAFRGLGWLDRLLALWILLAMVAGVLLGNFVSSIGPALRHGTFVGVSVPIGASPSASGVVAWDYSTNNDDDVLAVGLLVMMYPILCKVKFETLHVMFGRRVLWVQIGFSIVVNWLVAPFVMVGPRRRWELDSLLISFLRCSWVSRGLFYPTSQSFARGSSWSVWRVA